LEPEVRLLKVDTEAQKALSARYQIRSIPSLILFAGAQEKARTAGVMTQQGIIDWARANVN
jgi:thioredoxin 2